MEQAPAPLGPETRDEPGPAPPPTPGPTPAPPTVPTAQETPDLAGGPEDGGRPRKEPPSPPRAAYLRGDPKYRLVALTFDDGPDATYTPRVLDALKAAQVPATFFVTGRRAQAHPELLRRMVQEGHEVGNHGFDHVNLAKAGREQVRREMAETHRLLRRLIGREVRIFRPPYGNVTPAVQDEAQSLGYRIVLWDIDSRDWKKGVSADQVYRNVVPEARNGAIILQHSAGGKGEDLSNTLQALPRIIQALRQKGYRFVTISQMLATGNPRPGQW